MLLAKFFFSTIIALTVQLVYAQSFKISRLEKDENIYTLNIKIDAISCIDKLYLIEHSDHSMELARWLSLMMHHERTEMITIRYEYGPCELVNQISGTYDIESWNGNATNGPFIYLPSGNKYTLFAMEGNGTWITKGCIHVQRTNDSVHNISFNFLDINTIDNRSEFGQTIDRLDDTLCEIIYKNPEINPKKNGTRSGYPIIFIPGIASSKIVEQNQYAKFNCSADGRIWYGFGPCILLNNNQKTFINGSMDKNILTGQPHWGHPAAVDSIFLLTIFETLTASLTKLGYEPGLSLRAAPYDFRQTPDEMSDFFIRFKTLIEETYLLNNNKKVLLLGHSMGNLITLHFLHQQSKAWKEHFIQSFISAAAPWGGSIAAVRFLMRGDVIRGMSRYLNWQNMPGKVLSQNWPSVLYLLPDKRVFGADYVLVKVGSKVYSVSNIEQLLLDLHLGHLIPKYHKIKNLTDIDVPPGVEVHCIYSRNSITDAWYKYSSKSYFPDKDIFLWDFIINDGDGDGYVSVQSAKWCMKWKDQQAEFVHEKSLHGLEHTALLGSTELLEYLETIIYIDG